MSSSVVGVPGLTELDGPFKKSIEFRLYLENDYELLRLMDLNLKVGESIYDRNPYGISENSTILL